MPVLNCSEFEQQLREAVETRKPPANALHRHAAECVGCRRLWEEYVLLERAVAAWTNETPSSDLADAVLAQYAFDESDQNKVQATNTTAVEKLNSAEQRVVLHATERASEHSSAPRHRRGTVAVVVAAALVLFVAVSGPFNGPSAVENSARDTTAVTAVPPASEDVSEADVQMVMRDASSAYLSLARDAANVFSDSVVLIPETVLPPIRSVPADAEEESRPDLGKEFDPIRRDVRHAIDFLIDVIVTDTEPAA